MTRVRELVEQLSPEEVVSLLRDHGEFLSARVADLSPELLRHQGDHSGEGGLGDAPQQVCIYHKPLPSQPLQGITCRVYRKGDGHNDPNSARLGTHAGGAINFGYGPSVSVGHLFSCGDNDVYMEVWRPPMIGIGKVTYHTRIDLEFSPYYWNPGGIVAWCECWGWYSYLGTESKLCNSFRCSIKISC